MKNKERLNYFVFRLPYDRIRSGYYSDKYFLRTCEILKKDRRKVKVLYQFFLKKEAVVCGIDEALAILKTCTGYYKDEEKAQKLFKEIITLDRLIARFSFKPSKKLLELYKKRIVLREKLNALWVDKSRSLKVKALYDGEIVKPYEIILTIEGNPAYFAYLETLLLGVIARATSTATAVWRVKKAAEGKPILFFSARFDHFWNQATDGYAAMVAGASGVSTDAQGDWWGIESMGTIPHSLIASYSGNTSLAAIKFDKYIHHKVNRIVLVDWENDCIGTTFKVLKDFYYKIFGVKPPKLEDLSKVIGKGKGKIWGVRFDTAENLRDFSVEPVNEKSLGVCPQLVFKARKEFDKYGLHNLKIVVSGGFDEKKIELFEKLNVPADAYGVGSSLLKSKIDITADVVKVNGKPCAKFGRYPGDYSRLKSVKL